MGDGVSQMTTLLHKPYSVKVSTKEWWVNDTQKSVHVVYGWPSNVNYNFINTYGYPRDFICNFLHPKMAKDNSIL